MRKIMKTAIVIIDMQNDFIRKDGSMCVPNGDKVAANITKFLKENKIDGVFASMDYHLEDNIASTNFWYTEGDKHVAPYTEITFDDVNLNKVKLKFHFYKVYLLVYLSELEKKGKKLIAWPSHCIQGTWGCDICDEINEILKSKENVEYIKKGENPYTEHYSIFKAEVPICNASLTGYMYLPYILETTNVPLISNITEDDKCASKIVNKDLYAPIGVNKDRVKEDVQNETTLNTKLLDELNSYDKVYICGVATDFCVRESIKDIVTYKPELCEKMVILKDCMVAIDKNFDIEKDEVYQKAIQLGTIMD